MTPDAVDAFILAGGQGARLRGLVDDRPKPMAEIAGRPFLEWLILHARSQGVRSVTLCTGYLSSKVEEYFGDGARWGVRIHYSAETSPLGTGGALRLAIPLSSSDTVLALNGDTYCRYDLPRLLFEHRRHKAPATMWLTAVDNSARFGGVVLNPDGSVASFEEKPAAGGACLVNAGVYAFHRRAIESIAAGTKVSLEHEVLPGLVGQGLRAVVGDSAFIDIGTPDSFARASTFMAKEMLT